MLSGAVADVYGNPVSGLIMMALGEGGAYENGTMTRGDGTWAMGVRDGTYNVHTWDRGARATE